MKNLNEELNRIKEIMGVISEQKELKKPTSDAVKTDEPTKKPEPESTKKPTAKPTKEPTSTPKPTKEPTSTPKPTPRPTPKPTETPKPKSSWLTKQMDRKPKNNLEKNLKAIQPGGNEKDTGIDSNPLWAKID